MIALVEIILSATMFSYVYHWFLSMIYLKSIEMNTAMFPGVIDKMKKTHINQIYLPLSFVKHFI